MNIEELKRLAEAATPGPWFAEASWQSTLLEGRHDGKWAVRSSKKSNGFSPLAYVKGDKRITGGDGSLNAQFIAAARDAVPELIAEVERVTKQRDELLAHIPEWHCKTCNTIHLPPDGFNLCCPTPKCTGLLKPSSQAIRIVEAQRDELLAALKGMVQLDRENHQRGEDDIDIAKEVQDAYNASAKAEG